MTEPTETTDAGSPGADLDLSYEQAREELVSVVQRLEAGGVGLEDSLALWERGEALAAVCQRWLDGARARLEQAQEAAGDGSATNDAT